MRLCAFLLCVLALLGSADIAAAQAAPAPAPGAAPPAPAPTQAAPPPAVQPEAPPPMVETPPPPAPATPDAAPAEPGLATAAPPPSEAPGDTPGETDPQPVETVRYVPKKGFELSTADKRFSITLGAWLQARYTWRGLPDADDRHDVELARARFIVSGNLFGEDTRYMLEMGLAPGELDRGPLTVDGEVSGQDALRGGPLLNTFIEFRQLADLRARIGQYKVPFSRQQLVVEPELADIERTVVDATFNFGRDIGVDLYSDDLFELDLLRYHLGIYGGEGRNAWSGTLGAGDEGFLYNARLELLPFGVFEEYTEVDFARQEQPRLSIGAAYAFLQSDATSPLALRYLALIFPSPDPAVADFNAHNVTADFMLFWSGLSLQSAFHWRKVTELPGGKDAIGFMVAANYLLGAIPLAPGASFALVRAIDDSPQRDENELTIFAGYYFHEHRLKLQLDYSRLWTGDADFGDGGNRIRFALQASL